MPQRPADLQHPSCQGIVPESDRESPRDTYWELTSSDGFLCQRLFRRSATTAPPREPHKWAGEVQRVISVLTTDSDTGPDSPRGTDRDNWHLRQVSLRVYHAPDPNDGTAPPFLPRIARTQANHRNASSRLMPARTPALEAHTPRGPPVLDDISPHTSLQRLSRP